MALKDRSMVGVVETIYRPEVARVIADIRLGAVNEDDLDKLQNFCMAALAMMSENSLAKYRYFQRRALEMHNEELAHSGQGPCAIDCGDDRRAADAAGPAAAGFGVGALPDE